MGMRITSIAEVHPKRFLSSLGHITQWCQRRKLKFTDDGRQVMTITHVTFLVRWAKTYIKTNAHHIRFPILLTYIKLKVPCLMLKEPHRLMCEIWREQQQLLGKYRGTFSIEDSQSAYFILFRFNEYFLPTWMSCFSQLLS